MTLWDSRETDLQSQQWKLCLEPSLRVSPGIWRDTGGPLTAYLRRPVINVVFHSSSGIKLPTDLHCSKAPMFWIQISLQSEPTHIFWPSVALRSFSTYSKSTKMPTQLHCAVMQLSIQLWYLHRSETFEPLPLFWALDCHCRGRTMFCLLPSPQYRVSKQQENVRSLLWIHLGCGMILALQLPRPVIFWGGFPLLPCWTLLCFLLHSQALEHQGEAGTYLYSPPSSVCIIPGKKEQHICYSITRKHWL